MSESTASGNDAEMLKVAREASELLLRQRSTVSDYLNSADTSGRTVLQKHDTEESFDSTDPTDGATTTAFAISRLSRATAKEHPSALSSTPPGLKGRDWSNLSATAIKDFVAMYGRIASDTGAKAAGDLPNYYSTPLHLRGLLATITSPDDSRDASIEAAVNSVVSVLIGWLDENPFVSGDSLKSVPGVKATPDLPALADGAPNWYLTYLIIDALAEYAISPIFNDDARQPHLIAALENARAASLLALSRMIALSSAGLSGIFDALDLGGCLATLGRCVTATGRSDLMTSRLVNRGVELLGTEFLTPYGAFAPKGPAMVDRSGALLEVSSSELAEIVLNSLSQLLEDRAMAFLLPAIRLTCQRADGHRGWGESNSGGLDRRDLFAASSSLALLSGFIVRMDQMRHSRAYDALDVEPVPSMGAIDYPQYLRPLIESKVISPIRQGRRDLAAMSMLLYGPPGTAKTTIARKIASDLGWPILELTPSRLLLTGFEEIASRAEDLFGLLSDLRDVVVLFDEFEGFIGRRDNDGASDASKFLTTFMLPKLHRLRDSGQVVFVVATNDQTAIDSAASRPGRIDTVLSVEPPSVDEVRQVVRTFAARTEPMMGAKDSWDALWDDLAATPTGETLSGLTYGYINRWVKDVALEFQDGYTKESALKSLSELRIRLSREGSAGAKSTDK